MRVAEVEVEFAELDGYSAEATASALLEGIGIPTQLHEEPMRAIAPGLKLRVLLAQALFSAPDVLLLDEPTNNLDMATVAQLGQALAAYEGALLIASHDLAFLRTLGISRWLLLDRERGLESIDPLLGVHP